MFSPDGPLANKEGVRWREDGLLPVRIRSLSAVSNNVRLILTTTRGDLLLKAAFRATTSKEFFAHLVHVIRLGAGPVRERQSWALTEIARSEYMLVKPADATSTRWTIQVQVLWRSAASYGSLVLPVRLPYRYLLGSIFPAGNSRQDNVSSAQIFYESADSTTEGKVASSQVRIEDITCELYPFQKRAVRWLLRREGVDVDDNGLLNLYNPPSEDDALPPTFMRGVDGLGRNIVYSHLYGAVTADAAAFRPDYVYLKGGILAEEMGVSGLRMLILMID